MLVKKAHYRSLTIYRHQWKQLFAKVVKLYRWAEEGRRNGILSLEDQANREENQFLATHLQDICDGTPPDILQRKMNVWSNADTLGSFERIMRAIEIEGIMAIQSGLNPRYFANFIVAYIPARLRERFEKRLAIHLDTDSRASILEIHRLYSSETPAPFVELTIRIFAGLKRGVKFETIRFSDAQVLAGVLFDAPQRFQSIILNRLALRRIDGVFQKMQQLGVDRLQKIQESAHEIFRQEISRWDVLNNMRPENNA